MPPVENLEERTLVLVKNASLMVGMVGVTMLGWMYIRKCTQTPLKHQVVGTLCPIAGSNGLLDTFGIWSKEY
jgi:hypothetical protein